MRAHAKINLFLDVTGKRPDGYHDIVSVMQTIGLHDELLVGGHDSGAPGAFSFHADCPLLPPGDGNIVCRAAAMMVREYKIARPFSIRLSKKIPVGAGLAGGSADCAAALVGINAFLGLGLPMDELLGMGRALGADVPFCLLGGTRLAEGIGDRLAPLPAHPDCAIVVAHPRIAVSTGEAFGKLSDADFRKKKPRAREVAGALARNDLTGVAVSLYNVFAERASADFPVIGNLLGSLASLGALGAAMSGTGSAVFGYFGDDGLAAAAAAALSDVADTFLTRPAAGRKAQ